jgi:hypothetical protein
MDSRPRRMSAEGGLGGAQGGAEEARGRRPLAVKQTINQNADRLQPLRRRTLRALRTRRTTRPVSARAGAEEMACHILRRRLRRVGLRLLRV